MNLNNKIQEVLMKGFIRKFLILSGVAVSSVIGFKIYNMIHSVINLEKTLPQYLENVFGEKPSLSIKITFKSSLISLTFSKETIEKHEGIESTIKEYLTDFYPNLKCNKFSIEILQKKDDEEIEDTDA